MASSTGFESVWGKHQDRSADVEEKKTAETTAEIHKSRQGLHMLQLWERSESSSWINRVASSLMSVKVKSR
jgi:hypothetical protein